MKKCHQGFTLVEIMIVVTLIAILAAIAMPNLLRARVDSNDAAAKVVLKAVAVALENYAIVNGIYPPDPSFLTGALPPYLNTDYFTGTHNGFIYSYVFTDYTYTVTGSPINSSQGTQSFTIVTGGVFQ